MAAPETPPGVDLDRLRAYFAAHVSDAGDRSLRAELISGGRSNLTYAIGDGEGRVYCPVVRRSPLPGIFASFN